MIGGSHLTPEEQLRMQDELLAELRNDATRLNAGLEALSESLRQPDERSPMTENTSAENTTAEATLDQHSSSANSKQPDAISEDS
jgi:hypothetical protein